MSTQRLHPRDTGPRSPRDTVLDVLRTHGGRCTAAGLSVAALDGNGAPLPPPVLRAVLNRLEDDGAVQRRVYRGALVWSLVDGARQ